MNIPNQSPYQPPAAYVSERIYPNAYGAPAVQGGVSDLAVESLRQTRPWVRVIAILMVVGAGFMLLAGVAMVMAGAFLPEGPGASKSPFPMALLGFVYLPLSALYLYPAFKLFKYSGSISRLLESRASADLEVALGHQKSFWKFSGIAALVMLAVYAVGFVGAIAYGVISSLGSH